MSLPTDAAARKAMPIFKFLTTYFPDAIEELVALCVQGNIQHNPERAPGDIVWAREKSTDQMDAAFRHMWDHERTGPMDVDGRYHLGKAAWRVLAELQLQIEGDRNERHAIRGPAAADGCCVLTGSSDVEPLVAGHAGGASDPGVSGRGPEQWAPAGPAYLHCGGGR